MIEKIKHRVASSLFEYSQHAVDQSVLRRISNQDIKEALGNGKIIEDYPEDKDGPSCLIFGRTAGGRRLHIQCSYPSRPLTKIITVYEPDPNLWIDYEKRK